MNEFLFLQEILLSFFVGALLGLERQYSKKSISLGLRTFSLTSIFATLTVIIQQQIGLENWLNIIGFIVTITFAIFLYLEDFRKKRKRGFTTNISFIITYLLGTMIAYGMWLESVFLSILVVIILFSKEKLHQITRHLTEKEVGDLLEFLILLGIVYPLLPKTFNLYGLSIPLNEMWLLVILISLINFVAFILSRKMGSKKEVEILSFLGGLISAVATMDTIVNIFKKRRLGEAKTIAGSFLIMASSSTVRNLIIILAMYPKTIMYIGLPFVFLIVALALAGVSKITKTKVPLIKIESPFNVIEGIKLVTVIFIIYVIMTAVGVKTNAGVLIVFALISGLINTTATAISLTSMAATSIITLPEMAIAMVIAQFGGYISQLGILALFKKIKAIENVYKETIALAATALAITIIVVTVI